MERQELDSRLLQAHAEDDKQALIDLYTLAADQSETVGDIDAACFYLTHAFVFALEAGAPEAAVLNRRLVERGRAHELDF